MHIGIIGLGMASKPHAISLGELREHVSCVAWSPSAARRAAFAETWKIPVVDKPEAIFADPAVDAVFILTPPDTHLELVEAAASHGKHVLLEKPVDISLARASAAVDAMDKAGLTLGIVFQNRFRPVIRILRAAIDEGRLGELVSVSARLDNWRPQTYYDEPGRGIRLREGSGVLMTQGIHTLDLMVSLVGLPRELVAYTTTSTVHRMETEDVATAVLRFDNGALGTIAATTCAYPGYADAIDIVGSDGTARLSGDRLEIACKDGFRQMFDDRASGNGAGADPMAFSHKHHRALIDDFLAAIGGAGQPATSGRDALRVHRLIDAMLVSAAEGRAVELGPG